MVAGAADGNALTVQAASGLVPPDGAAAVPVPGSPTHPWRLAGTFSLRTETRLAATGFSVNGTLVAVPLTDGVQPGAGATRPRADERGGGLERP